MFWRCMECSFSSRSTTLCVSFSPSRLPLLFFGNWGGGCVWSRNFLFLCSVLCVSISDSVCVFRDYPDFYRKLYHLMQPEIFHVKYRAKFLTLASLFLTSTYIHLPYSSIFFLSAAFSCLCVCGLFLCVGSLSVGLSCFCYTESDN